MLSEGYYEILIEQLQSGIIEGVELDSLEDEVFIPHRPVLKQDNQCTTKFRIVLNCSLKSNQGSSLNEAAYHGVDLLNNIAELLMKFWFGKYFMMSDIGKVFLHILFNDERKFNILWYDDNRK